MRRYLWSAGIWLQCTIVRVLLWLAWVTDQPNGFAMRLAKRLLASTELQFTRRGCKL